MNEDVARIYGNKVRVRACGICRRDNRLLLVNHSGITPGNFWAPPGGGIDFGQSIDETLKKEFLEETGLSVSVGKFMFGCELIAKPLHAIELFFSVTIESGKLKVGSDPELQIIQNVRFMSNEDIGQISKAELHGIFSKVKSPEHIGDLSGFFRI